MTSQNDHSDFKVLVAFTAGYSVMHCAIWYHVYNLKHVKNTHGGRVLLLVKLQALGFRDGCHSRFLNCTNRTRSHERLKYV